MTATLTFSPDITDLDRWQALSHYERHRILAFHWLRLNPADAHARFAAAMGVLALVDEELAAAQYLVDHAVERALAEASASREDAR
ncbi:hypothetical protein [Nonomuraea sp. NPDC049129]|uniref:hypothetical protein n=1 Tax=Nonomuraea sp. NPDC049129 TaxID=3155272 RepID=UPI0033E4455F